MDADTEAMIAPHRQAWPRRHARLDRRRFTTINQCVGIFVYQRPASVSEVKGRRASRRLITPTTGSLQAFKLPEEFMPSLTRVAQMIRSQRRGTASSYRVEAVQYVQPQHYQLSCGEVSCDTGYGKSSVPMEGIPPKVVSACLNAP